MCRASRLETHRFPYRDGRDKPGHDMKIESPICVSTPDRLNCRRNGAAGEASEDKPMLKTIEAFDRIGEENAFAVLARANALAAQGRDIISLGIGQPDFRTPDFIVEAAIKALRDGHHGYTPATGIPQLREAVAGDLHKRFNVDVSPDSVMIMPGGKPTMFMSILMFGEPGAEIMYPDPGFPIYRSMIEYTGARPVPVPVREEN